MMFSSIDICCLVIEGRNTMNLYYLIGIIVVIALVLISEVVNGLLGPKNGNQLTIAMIMGGVGLIITAFPGVLDCLVNLLQISISGEVTSSNSNIIQIICGFILISFGFASYYVLKDRIFVLNMFGLYVQPEISEEKNIKDLKLSDFKVREAIIDFVDIFKSKSKMSDDINDTITKKISYETTKFKNRSNGFKSCFTGMGPIPYTIFAGTYLADSHMDRYFEYKRSDNKYIELKKKKKGYPVLLEQFPENPNINSKDVIVTLSITQMIQDNDAVQFGNLDIIKIKLDNPANNVIISINQLYDYKDKIMNCLEKLKNEYTQIERIYLLASIPSCMSLEIGKMIALNSNRIPKVISCHYVMSETPRYPFGIVITDNASKSEKGKLILF